MILTIYWSPTDVHFLCLSFQINFSVWETLLTQKSKNPSQENVATQCLLHQRLCHSSNRPKLRKISLRFQFWTTYLSDQVGEMISLNTSASVKIKCCPALYSAYLPTFQKWGNLGDLKRICSILKEDGAGADFFKTFFVFLAKSLQRHFLTLFCRGTVVVQPKRIYSYEAGKRKVQEMHQNGRFESFRWNQIAFQIGESSREYWPGWIPFQSSLHSGRLSKFKFR